MMDAELETKSGSDQEIVNAETPLKIHYPKSLVEYLKPRHMDHKIDLVSGDYQYDTEIEKLGNTKKGYDPKLVEDDEMDEAASCDGESINSKEKKIYKTAENTEQLTSKDPKIINQFIPLDSYIHDDDDPHISRSKRNEYLSDDENLIMTHSTFKREGSRWRKDAKGTYNLFRVEGDVIVPVEDVVLENSIISPINDANDKSIAVYEKDSPDLKEHNEDEKVDSEFGRYIDQARDKVHQRQPNQRTQDDLYKKLDRILKKTNLEDFFRDPVASVVEVLEHFSIWVANMLSLTPPDPIDHDKVIYKREEKIANISIPEDDLLKDDTKKLDGGK